MAIGGEITEWIHKCLEEEKGTEGGEGEEGVKVQG